MLQSFYAWDIGLAIWGPDSNCWHPDNTPALFQKMILNQSKILVLKIFLQDFYIQQIMNIVKFLLVFIHFICLRFYFIENVKL